MTPTQPSQAVESERENFEAHMRKINPSYDDGLLFGLMADGVRYSSLVTQKCWLSWQARAELARQQEAPVGGDLNWRKLVEWWESGAEDWEALKAIILETYIAASRVLVALPAEPVCYIHRDKLKQMQDRRQVDDADTTVRYFNGFPNWVSPELQKEWIALCATPAPPKQQPDHLAGGECGVVPQPLTDDEIIDIWAGVSTGHDDTINIIELARAIEAAHGIGKAPRPSAPTGQINPDSADLIAAANFIGGGDDHSVLSSAEVYRITGTLRRLAAQTKEGPA